MPEEDEARRAVPYACARTGAGAPSPAHTHARRGEHRRARAALASRGPCAAARQHAPCASAQRQRLLPCARACAREFHHHQQQQQAQRAATFAGDRVPARVGVKLALSPHCAGRARGSVSDADTDKGHDGNGDGEEGDAEGEGDEEGKVGEEESSSALYVPSSPLSSPLPLPPPLSPPSPLSIITPSTSPLGNAPV